MKMLKSCERMARYLISRFTPSSCTKETRIKRRAKPQSAPRMYGEHVMSAHIAGACVDTRASIMHTHLAVLKIGQAAALDVGVHGQRLEASDCNPGQRQGRQVKRSPRCIHFPQE